MSLNPRLAASIVLVALLMPMAAKGAGTIVLPQQDEALQNRRRGQWIERIHRAAPGTDWRLIEAANREQARLFLDSLGSQRATGAAAWSEVGADGTTGRTLCVAQSAADPNRLYVGSALGGMWSGNVAGGPAWIPQTDALGIGAQQVVVVPRAGRDDFVIADGGSRVVYTTDGGVSWNVPAGLPDGFWNARRLVQDAAAPLRLFALVDEWYWNGFSWEIRTRLSRSEDGGLSFTTLREDPASTGVDLWMNRLTGGAVWLLVGNHLSRSTDHGAVFIPVSTVPVSFPDGASVAGSEAGAPVLYALVHSFGAWHLYSSHDAGATWQVRNAPVDCWGAMSACITDSAQVFVGGVECSRSTDGGATFTSLNGWGDYYTDPAHKLHADIRGIQSLIVPTGSSTTGERVYVSTDGGTWRLDLAGSAPQNLTLAGLRNAQYYSVRSSRSTFGRIAVGSQDQGYQTTTSAPAFTPQISGDYGHLTGSLAANDMVWSVYPGFMLLQLTEQPVNLELPYPDTNFPGDPNIPWMPAILADPDNASSVLFGGRYLWRITRTAPLAYDYSTLWDFDRGITDAVGAVAIAPTDHQRWYVATYNGGLFHSADAGASFTPSADTGPASHYFYGSDLLVSPTKPLVAYACGSGYSNAGVYKSTDGGVTWTPYGTGLPATLVHRLAFDNDLDQTVYAATEAGPWRCVGGAWENLLTSVPGAPLTDYWDLESIPNRAIVRFATYGRGLWDFHTASTASVASGGLERGVRLQVGPNPARGSVRLAYAQSEAGPVRIEVFDVTGRRVSTPLDRWCPAGDGVAPLELRDSMGRRLPAGIYLVRLRARQQRVVRQLVVAN